MNSSPLNRGLFFCLHSKVVLKNFLFVTYVLDFVTLLKAPPFIFIYIWYMVLTPLKTGDYPTQLQVFTY
ncbi:MAG TPA: hypothetical protein DEG69_24020 [Flavobacteriaceae bacterium]|nr:hypothetical protein [Flavobacteriaceae bacterium]